MRRRLLVVSAILWLACCGYLLSAISFRPVKKADRVASYLDVFSRPVILCHRGSKYMGPENSIHMHEWALKMGCDVLEFDVRLTKDRQLVVYHDESLDRVCDKRGPVSNYTLEELAEVDAGYWYTHEYTHDLNHSVSEKSFPFRGKEIGISSLPAFLDRFPGSYKNIEIKDDDLLASELLWRELQKRPEEFNKIIVSSRWCRTLRYLRDISNGSIAIGACEKEVSLFVILHKLGISNLFFKFFKPVAQVYQIPTGFHDIQLAEPEIVSAAHNLGQRIMFWVINDAEKIEQLIKLGADGIVTDRPDIAYQTFHRLGLVSESLESKLDGVEVNSTKSFFIPSKLPQEIHRPVSSLTKIVSFFLNAREQHLAFAMCELVIWLCIIFVL